MSAPAVPPALQLALAYGVDLAVGDPPFPPHPVVLIGRTISGLERAARAVCRSPSTLRLAGVALAATVAGGAFGLASALLAAARAAHPWLEAALSIWLLSTAIAARGLRDAAWAVLEPLRGGDLPEARRRLAHIVGRDTAGLPGDEIVRAAVETVAENASDGVVAPLLYALLGGAPLALAYKAVNTLDSMIGHRDERYLHFGWASARLDDLANLIPARLTALLFVIAAAGARLDWRRAWHTACRDAGKHQSPNAGWPEAAVAGALGVRLGGLNRYDGEPSLAAFLGEPLAPLTPDHIALAVRLMLGASHLAAALCAGAAAAGLGRWS